MLPVLSILADGSELHRRELADGVAQHFGLSSEELSILLPSGKTTVVRSRTGWALTYMKQAGLVESTRRGFYRITPAGTAVLVSAPGAIDNEYLSQFESFRAFKTRSRDSTGDNDTVDPTPASTLNMRAEVPPDEALENAYGRLREAVESELLDTIKRATPRFFEELVVDLLVRMGYGGNRAEAARALGRAGDGGIDGVIDEDRLGLNSIYLQAKRWDAPVGRPELQKFAGALQGQRATKGVFLTTSSYTREAEEYAHRIGTRIVLIDGRRLASLMFEHDVGVTTRHSYAVKEIDSDYFEES